MDIYCIYAYNIHMKIPACPGSHKYCFDILPHIDHQGKHFKKLTESAYIMGDIGTNISDNAKITKKDYHSLLLQADLELGKRGFTGPVLYMVLFISFPFTTSIYEQYPALIIYPGILITLFSIFRFCLSLFIKKLCLIILF